MFFPGLACYMSGVKQLQPPVLAQTVEWRNLTITTLWVVVWDGCLVRQGGCVVDVLGLLSMTCGCMS